MKYNEYIEKDYVYGALTAKVLRVVYKQDTSVIWVLYECYMP